MSTPIELTREHQAALARLAMQSGKSWEQVLEEALASYQRDAEKANGSAESVGKAMARLGLLGCLTDAPPDLSTNPRYMEGFGNGAN
jgi:hypothetical protein